MTPRGRSTDDRRADARYRAPMLDEVRQRVRRADPLTIDTIFALALAALSLIGHVLEPREARPPDAMGSALILFQTLPLIVRRRWPVAVLIVTGIATGLYAATGQRSTAANLGVLFALYTVAAHTDRRRAVESLIWTFGGMTVTFGLAAWQSAEPLSIPVFLEELGLNYLIFGTAWILGDIMRSRRAYARELELRNVQLVEEREENARLAVRDERSRIARELHDVVAHHVSVMVVQAGGARRTLEARGAPEEPEDPIREALDSIESTGRQTLTEMRRMLGLLRTEEAEERAPQPSLDRLDDLLAQVREAGLPVELTVEGTPHPLPAGVELSAYRIVQEALTNTLKHAGRASAKVSLRYGERDFEVEVADDGRGAAAALLGPTVSGHGLIGMRERVSALWRPARGGPGCPAATWHGPPPARGPGMSAERSTPGDG